MTTTKKGRPAKPQEVQADTVIEAGEQIAKRKGNNPKDNFMQEHVKKGDNARYLRMARAAVDLPPIDIADPEQVSNRIGMYFDFCEQNDRKPSMLGIANWLGIDRTTLASWKRGEYRGTTHSHLIEKAVMVLEELWTDYMQNGLVNPVSGIFLGKVMFGYKDVQDYVITPNQPLGPDGDPSTMAGKYQNALPVTTIIDGTEDKQG
jgi:hypothetical protein